MNPLAWRVGRLALAALAFGLGAAGAASATPGALTQLTDPDACVSHIGADTGCVDGKAMQDPAGIAISPNGVHLYVGATGSDSVAAFKRNETTGAISQLDGLGGCISDNGTGGACANGRALLGPVAIAISPDGKFVYVATQVSNALAVLKRTATTGVLTQVAGLAGCVSQDGTDGSGGACTDGRALDRPYAIAISPDGTYLYVASEFSYAVAAFKRNKTTGALTQLAGTDGCVSEAGDDGCADGVALREARAIAISPDGLYLYVAAEASDAVAVFKRKKLTGVMTQLTGLNACVSETGSGGTCRDGKALAKPVGLAVSPDGKSLYVVSLDSNAVAVFQRNKTTGVLTQLAGANGCVSEGGVGGCAVGTGLSGARAVVVSADNKFVYVASQTSSAVAVFARNLTTGALTQLASPDACVSADGTGGDCTAGIGLGGARTLKISPGLAGKHLYVGSFVDDAVAAFDREK